MRALGATILTGTLAAVLAGCVTVESPAKPQPASTPTETDSGTYWEGCRYMTSGLEFLPNDGNHTVSDYADGAEKLATELTTGAAAAKREAVKTALTSAAQATAKVTDALRSTAGLSTTDKIAWYSALNAATAVCNQPPIKWLDPSQ